MSRKGRLTSFRRSPFFGDRKEIPVLCFRRSELPKELQEAEPIVTPYCSEPIYAFVPVSRLKRALSVTQKTSQEFVVDLLLRTRRADDIRLFRYDYGNILGQFFLSYLPLSFFQEVGFPCDDASYRWYLDCSAMPSEAKARLLVLSYAGMFAPAYYLTQHPHAHEEPFLREMLRQHDPIAFNPVVSDLRPLLLWVWLPIYELSKRITDYPEELVQWAATHLFRPDRKKFPSRWSFKCAQKASFFYASKVKQVADRKIETAGGLIDAAEAII